MDEPSDAQLVQAITGGGEAGRAAELRLCRRFAPRVRLYGLRHLRDETRAADLVQTVLLAVIEAARGGRVREPEQLARFVLGVCRNAALRTREVERRTEPGDPDLAAASGSALPALDLDRPAMLRCFMQLESRARHVLLLSFAEEKSAEEIGCTLSLTAGHVRVMRHRALAALRDCLECGTTGGAR